MRGLGVVLVAVAWVCGCGGDDASTVSSSSTAADAGVSTGSADGATSVVDGNEGELGDDAELGDDGEGEIGEVDGEGGDTCESDCCRDNIEIVVEGAGDAFVLTFDIPALLSQPVISCPDGPHDASSWTVVCEPGLARIDAEGIGSFGSGTVSADGGPAVSLDDLEFRSCDCNCQPVEGVITISPQGGTTGTNSGSGSSGGTGTETGTGTTGG